MEKQQFLFSLEMKQEWTWEQGEENIVVTLFSVLEILFQNRKRLASDAKHRPLHFGLWFGLFCTPPLVGGWSRSDVGRRQERGREHRFPYCDVAALPTTATGVHPTGNLLCSNTADQNRQNSTFLVRARAVPRGDKHWWHQSLTLQP